MSSFNPEKEERLYSKKPKISQRVLTEYDEQKEREKLMLISKQYQDQYLLTKPQFPVIHDALYSSIEGNIDIIRLITNCPTQRAP